MRKREVEKDRPKQWKLYVGFSVQVKEGQEGAVNKELQMYIGKLNRTFCLLHRNFPKLEA